MKYPSLKEEEKLARQGFKIIVGLDEAGRGPLAGPVVACALTIKTKNPAQIPSGLCGASKKLKRDLGGVRDSKKLTPKKREELFHTLATHPQIRWATGSTSEKVIDKINIFEATKLAMKRAVKGLEKRYSHADFLILDGNFRVNLPIWQTSIIKADEKVFSCACASIIAKVRRDMLMERYHKKYPRYGFARHKGYGTKQHMRALKKYGPCEIHRRSFRPVRKIKNKKPKIKNIHPP